MKRVENLANKMKEYLLSQENENKNKYRYNSLKTGLLKTIYNLKYDKPVLIYGDYDTDGILSSLMMYVYLKKIKEKTQSNSKIDIVFSDRKSFFGMGEMLYKQFSKEYDLIIMTDNGSEEDFLNENINNLIILDHHPTQNEYDYIINPNIKKTNYSTSGGKVVFDFIKLLDDNLKNILNVSFFKNKDYFNIFKELTAITLISDMANLNKHNREFIIDALNTMREKKLPVFNLLSDFNSMEISFKLVSPINAISRMEEDLNLVTKWLFPKNRDEFHFVNKKINQINNQKKELVSKIYSQITKEEFNQDLLFINSNIAYLQGDIKIGLTGLLANKFLTEFNKPSIVIAKEKEYFVGSARGNNIKNFFNYIKNNNPDFFQNGEFGGHLDAMGFRTKDIKDLETIKKHLHLYENNKHFNLLDDKPLNLKEYAYLKKEYLKIAQGVDFDKKVNLFLKNNLKLFEETNYKNYTLFSFYNEIQDIKFLIPNEKVKEFKNSKYLLVELNAGDIENLKICTDNLNDVNYKLIKDNEIKIEIQNLNEKENILNSNKKTKKR